MSLPAIVVGVAKVWLGAAASMGIAAIAIVRAEEPTSTRGRNISPTSCIGLCSFASEPHPELAKHRAFGGDANS